MPVKEFTARLSHFWSSDHSLTVLLVVVMITVFVLFPLLDLGLASGLLLHFFLLLILASGIVAVSGNMVFKCIAIFCALANFLLRWVADFEQSVGLSSWTTRAFRCSSSDCWRCGHAWGTHWAVVSRHSQR